MILKWSFETFIISEMIKELTNSFQPLNMYFWRDNVGNEIDCIQEAGDALKITEIKSGSTIQSDFTKAFHYFVKRVSSEKIYF